jgi:mannose-6-phosphate isomerase
MATQPLYPLIFQPILKERVWGGRRLEQLYGKNLPPTVPVGESWEISDRPGDVSVIANGELAGKDLRWLVENCTSELMGQSELQNGRFPLLIKILDARDKLSLQVHPPASRAAQLGGEPKTEMWYIAEAGPAAQLYVGLKRGCTRLEFADRIQRGTVADCFHQVRVRVGDAMFLPSGRVHALGADMVIFEIQQNSDTTYRVFDWNRLGLDGRPRELHIQESIQSIDFDDFEPGLLRPEPRPGPVDSATLVNDALFSVAVSKMRTEQQVPTEAGKLQIIGVVSGNLRIGSDRGEMVVSKGQFCLLPAALASVTLKAQEAATLLHVQTSPTACL